MTSLDTRLQESIAYLRERTDSSPTIGIVLGSGLGDFVDNLDIEASVPTSGIPHYPASSVVGHKGRILFGTLGGRGLLAFQGRVHFYESNSIESVLYPVRIAHLLGVRILIVTNAAGGINRAFAPGDLMLITDQINLTNNKYSYGSYRIDSVNILYSKQLIRKSLTIARESGISVRSGVYVGLRGPSYETISEVEMVHRLGGDAVGMSTVLEVSLASRLGMEVLGISCITNLGTGIGSGKLSHEEVTAVGSRVKKTFSLLVSSIVGGL